MYKSRIFISILLILSLFSDVSCSEEQAQKEMVQQLISRALLRKIPVFVRKVSRYEALVQLFWSAAAWGVFLTFIKDGGLDYCVRPFQALWEKGKIEGVRGCLYTSIILAASFSTGALCGGRALQYWVQGSHESMINVIECAHAYRRAKTITLYHMVPLDWWYQSFEAELIRYGLIQIKNNQVVEGVYPCFFSCVGTSCCQTMNAICAARARHKNDPSRSTYAEMIEMIRSFVEELAQTASFLISSRSTFSNCCFISS